LTFDPLNQTVAPFDRVNGVALFRGVHVEFTRVEIGGAAFEIAGLRDAADLLDDSDYAARFEEQDIAPYGLQLWPSSIVLSEFLMTHGRTGCGSALELGCGLGLASVVAARHGWHVTATDYDEAALGFAAYNARCNGVDVASLELLDWRDPPQGRSFDLIFGADLTYQLVDHKPLSNCIRSMLAPGGVAFLSDPCRGVADHFPDVARSADLRVSVVSGTLPAVRIWRIDVPG